MRILASHLKNGLAIILGFTILYVAYLTVLQFIPLSENDGKVLLEISRSRTAGDQYEGAIPPRLSKRRPVFVSFYQNGTRIACLGYTKPFFPLYESVGYLSSGLGLEQPSEVEIVVTVFGRYEKLERNIAIPPGKGVMVSRDGVESAELPFTFQELNLTTGEALDLAARKAGFPGFSWDEFDAYTFDAQVFRSQS